MRSLQRSQSKSRAVGFAISFPEPSIVDERRQQRAWRQLLLHRSNWEGKSQPLPMQLAQLGSDAKANRLPTFRQRRRPLDSTRGRA
jgi:hypothetical protein